MDRITVLALYDRISVFHTLKPFLFSRRHHRRFTFTRDPDYVLRRDHNRVLVIVRWFLKPDRVDLEFLRAVRQKYERIAFFNGNAGGGIPRLEVLPYVDLFFNKAVFRDRSLYSRRFYGDELFSDYYHQKYGVVDDQPTLRQVIGDPQDLQKIRLSWNIGVADFPNQVLRQRAAVACARLVGLRTAKPFFHRDFWRAAPGPQAPRPYPVHARLGFPARKSIHFQRKLILEKIGEHPGFLTGRVPQAQYNREVRGSRIVLSPFGWGEICHRDYEAVYNRALLLKPDMSHIETWPDVFIPSETYAPFDWDASDLVQKAERYLEDEGERRRVTGNAFDAYRSQLDGLEERFDGTIQAILAGDGR